MPNVLNEFAGDGVTRTFNFSMTGGYLSRDFVVFLTRPNDSLLDYTPYTGTVVWVSDFTVEISEPIPVGTTFVITRKTTPEAMIDFQTTSRLTERNLDTAFNQSLHRTVELDDLTERRMLVQATLVEEAVAAAVVAETAAVESANAANVAQSLVASAESAAVAAAASAQSAEEVAGEALELIQQAVKGNVVSFNGRDGAVMPQTGDYSPQMVGFVNDGYLNAEPVDSQVPAWDDPYLNTQAQALLNRTEVLKDNQKRTPLIYATYAEASAAAATLPDGQVVVSEADEVTGVVSSGAIAAEQSVYKVADYAKIRSYVGRGTRLRVVDSTGTHWWVRRGAAADNGGTVLKDALNRSWAREFSGAADVKWFGAKADGVTDDTAAIQAAIDAAPPRGSVYLPSGIYKVSAPILITRSDITLYGDSNVSTYLLRTDGRYGDTITVASATPDTVAVYGVVIRDLRIQCNADMENGGHIHLVNVAASFFTNLTLFNGYRGFWLEGVRTSHFTTTLVQAGTYAASARAGSAYVFIGLPRTPALENTELFFSDFNWEFAGRARRIENGLVIQECDGIFFSNGHIFGASNADLYMLSSASSDQMLAAIFDHVWFDQQCDRNLHISGNGALFGLCRFSACRFTGADSYNVLVSASSSLQGLAFIGCEFGVGTLDQAVDLFSGNNVAFNGCRFEQIDSDSSSTSDAYIVVRESSTLGKLSVTGCTFVGDAKLKDGIKLLNGTTEYTITGNTFVDFSTVSGEEIYTNQAVLTGSLSGNVTDRTFSIAATAGTQYVTPLCSFANLTGASVNITAVTPKWNGREISFRADTYAKTLAEGVEIVSASGGDIAIPVGRVRSLIYSRGQDRWYQK